MSGEVGFKIKTTVEIVSAGRMNLDSLTQARSTNSTFGKWAGKLLETPINSWSGSMEAMRPPMSQ